EGVGGRTDEPAACMNATRYCDVTDSTCVACLSDFGSGQPGPCPDATAPICVGGTCQPCNTMGTVNCPNGLLCDTGTGECHQCVTDKDCPNTPEASLCDNGMAGTFTCVSCMSEMDADGRCMVKTNGADDFCATTLANAGECVQCIHEGHTDCSPMQVCDLTDPSLLNTCQDCVGSTDCATSASSPICSSNLCGPCTTDQQCIDRNGQGPSDSCQTSTDTLTVNNPGQCLDCSVTNTDPTTLVSTSCPSTGAPFVDEKQFCDLKNGVCEVCLADYAATNAPPGACPTAEKPVCTVNGCV